MTFSAFFQSLAAWQALCRRQARDREQLPMHSQGSREAVVCIHTLEPKVSFGYCYSKKPKVSGDRRKRISVFYES